MYNTLPELAQGDEDDPVHFARFKVVVHLVVLVPDVERLWVTFTSVLQVVCGVGCLSASV